jgi:altronate hydrolase
MQKPVTVTIHPSDNVAVAIEPLEAGTEIVVGGERIELVEPVPAGHKIALRDMKPGDRVVKFGFPIGSLTGSVTRGAWIHSHNLKTALEGVQEYRYEPAGKREAGRGTQGQQQKPGAQGSDPRSAVRGPQSEPTFLGYRRADGRVGTRNELWILSTVGCVNHAAERIARIANDRYAGRIDGVHTFSHPYGCSQLGDDLANTQRVLAGLMRHPNAGAVLVLGLGCENNQMESLLALAGDVDRQRLRFFNSQEVVDEIEKGLEAVAELVGVMEGDRRTECPASELVIGHKCGGSDGFSGISANALVGRIADRHTALKGSVVLTEVPEMFGAEQVLMNRAADEQVFHRTVEMINGFKEYFLRHDQPVYENPSPGNKAGGLTTLEEKSLGAIQKGGQATVSQVLRYGEPIRGSGLSLLEAPGNDGVSCTAMVASGATVLLFTTGRGTPLGFPVPTIKISSNSAIAERKPHWIDFNAGALLDGTRAMEELADELFAQVLDVASGRILANNEKHGYREIAIWKEGVTL